MNNGIQIQPEQLALIKNILSKWLPHTEVWAFGSRVNGDPKVHSDLDLVIIHDSPLRLQTLAQLKNELSESDLPFKVDLIEWAITAEPFRKIIVKRYEILLTGSQTEVADST